MSPLFECNKPKRHPKELYTILVLSRHNYLRTCLQSQISWVEISDWSDCRDNRNHSSRCFLFVAWERYGFLWRRNHMLHMRQLRCMVSGQRMWWRRIFRLNNPWGKWREAFWCRVLVLSPAVEDTASVLKHSKALITEAWFKKWLWCVKWCHKTFWAWDTRAHQESK